MTKLDIYGGLLGAGKTTLIKAMLRFAYQGKKTAVIENEIGRVNLDAGEFTGITVRPLTAGCVCCTLKGDMVTAIRELISSEAPEYIVMEASGAADLDAIRRICDEIDEVALNRCVMVVNARKIRKLMTVVGEFYRIQLREASVIYLNFTEGLPREELSEVRRLLQEINPGATVIDTPIARLSADSIPEGLTHPAGPASGQGPDVDRPALTVMDPQQAFRLLPTRRPARAFGPSPLGAGRSGSHPGKTLYTTNIKAPGPLTDQALEHFRRQLERHGVWRAKGFVAMRDGSIRKIDYTFGDLFTADRDSGTSSVAEGIVLIGEDRQALSEGDVSGRFFAEQLPSDQ